jgi:hypothetical protein
MKYLKHWNIFIENAGAGAGSAGSGDVSNPLVGSLAGVASVSGSGDISFYLKKIKRKKGNPSQVSDMRDLAPAKGVKKIKESYMLSDEENNTINDCVIELIDDGYGFTMLQHEKEREWFDTDEGEKDYFDYEELLIGLHKSVETTWSGNISIRCKFNKNEVIDKRISTMRGTPINDKENKLVNDVEDIVFQIINQLGYDEGTFTVSFLVAGSSMPWNSTRTVSNNINITLWRKL